MKLAWSLGLRRVCLTFDPPHLVNGGLVELHQALHHLPADHGEEAEDQDHGVGIGHNHPAGTHRH